MQLPAKSVVGTLGNWQRRGPWSTKDHLGKMQWQCNNRKERPAKWYSSKTSPKSPNWPTPTNCPINFINQPSRAVVFATVQKIAVPIMAPRHKWWPVMESYTPHMTWSHEGGSYSSAESFGNLQSQDIQAEQSWVLMMNSPPTFWWKCLRT